MYQTYHESSAAEMTYSEHESQLFAVWINFLSGINSEERF